jgi:hypothetical protein
MDAKLKAKELVEKMAIYHWTDVCDYEGAKQCALIAVDEILNIEHPQIIIYTEIIKNSIRDYFQDEYWEEVKKEIQKL